MLKPLSPGDNIAIIAPASPFDPEKLKLACTILGNKGYGLLRGKHSMSRNGYLAGTEAQRAEDLMWAFSDPEVSAILCIRGGYGSGRMLPWLPFPIMHNSPKVFIGYSDITFLHLAIQSKAQLVTFHGPNLLDLAETPDRTDEFLHALNGRKEFSWKINEDGILRNGTASGTLIGGNLTCLAHLIGTPYLPDLAGCILLLEDCCEALYRLDRLFNQLKLAGILRSLAGLVLGSFKDCGEVRSIYDMVSEHVAEYNYPVVVGLPFGHTSANDLVPLGTSFTLNTYERTFKALRSPFIH